MSLLYVHVCNHPHLTRNESQKLHWLTRPCMIWRSLPLGFHFWFLLPYSFCFSHSGLFPFPPTWPTSPQIQDFCVLFLVPGIFSLHISVLHSSFRALFRCFLLSDSFPGYPSKIEEAYTQQLRFPFRALFSSWDLRLYKTPQGSPGGTSGKEPACQCKRYKKHTFSPWYGKIPWRREWLPTPVLLLEESQGQRSLADYSPWGRKESDMTEAT